MRIGAQDPEYFIYLQSERSQPFYVRYDGKLLSSSDKGYLIISKLHAGTASFRIGFANGGAQEQQFLVRISGSNDQGYLIKKAGEDGLMLYNLQTFASIKPSKDGAKKEAVAAVVKDTPTATSSDATMAALQKDLETTFPKTDDVSVGPGSRPVNPVAAPAAVPVAAAVIPPPVKTGGNKFSKALDKVVSDDRPEELPVEEPVVAATPPPATVDSAVVTEAPAKKGRKRRRDREALTAEEQQIAADVIAEERNMAAAVETPAPVAAVEETPAPAPAPVEEEPIVTTKKNKKDRKKTNEPAFIDFSEDSAKQARVTPATAPVFVETPVTEEKPAKKKKRSKEEIAERSEVIKDTASGYGVDDLVIDRKERKKKKRSEDDGGVAAPVVAAAPVPATDIPVEGSVSKKDRKKKKQVDEEQAATAVAAPVEEKSSLKMINSDCANVLDDTNFRKLLRRFVGGKDDDGMIDVFRKQTKGYCLETSQIKTLVQLLGANEARYRLLDLAYPKVADSEHYASLESVLTDDYYKGRFKAMLHK